MRPEKLAACPACKSKDVDVACYGRGDDWLYYARCKTCGHDGPGASDPVRAVAAWNGMRKDGSKFRPRAKWL